MRPARPRHVVIGRLVALEALSLLGCPGKSEAPPQDGAPPWKQHVSNRLDTCP